MWLKNLRKICNQFQILFEKNHSLSSMAPFWFLFASRCSHCLFTSKHVICCNGMHNLHHLSQYLLELNSLAWPETRYSNSYEHTTWLGHRRDKKTKPNSYFLCLIPHVLLLLVKQTINPMLEGWVDGGESDWMRNRQKKFSPFITYNPDCIKKVTWLAW